MKRFARMRKRAVGRICLETAAVLSCVFLMGCGKADKAFVPLGEPLSEPDASADAVEPGVCGAENIGGMDYPADAGTGISDCGEETGEPSVIYVHVCGAVREPGVVTLPEGSRGQAALEAAGGFAEDASRDAVNLAEVLTDGMKLYFPTKEEQEASQCRAQDKSDGLVNINTAGKQALCALPGIGEAKAEAIVAYREANGAFQSAEDIMKVPGIKDKAYQEIKALITVR